MRSAIALTRTACLATTLMVVLSCTDEPGRSAAAVVSTSPLVEQRTFDLRVGTGATSTRVGPSSTLFDNEFDTGILNRLELGCTTALHDERFDFDHVEPDPIVSDDTCGSPAVIAQQVSHCIGLRFLTLAQAIAPFEITIAGDVRQAPPEGSSGESVAFVMPPPTTSDAASLTLLAITYLQQAALQGAAILDLENCDDQTLDATLPAGNLDSPGWSEQDLTTFGFVVAASTVESLHALDEASRIASELLKSASLAQRSDDPDLRRATTKLWRAPRDSRLEIVRMLHGVPGNLFEPEEGIASIGGEAPAGNLAIVDTQAETEHDRRAEDLLRALAVDPRLDDDVLYDAVAVAMDEDFPDVFDGAPTGGPEFLAHIGIEPSTIRQAAARLRAESVALGRPIRTKTGAGTSRVYGTQRSAAAAEPAFLFARTVGAGTFDDLPESASDDHHPGTAYAERGVLPTIDVVGIALERAAARTDLSAAARNVVESGRLFVRGLVPMRMHLSIGQPLGGMDGLSEARVRLYGADVENPGRYELWLGEEGLQCALRGEIEGEPCDTAEHRIDVTPTVGVDGVESGLGPRYLQWEIPGEDCVVPGCVIPQDARLYLTRSGSPRRGIGGAAVAPGSVSTAFSRTTVLALGPNVLEPIAEAVRPAAVHTIEPQLGCAGISRDHRLPLEDELTEAAEGSDGIESSFYHYLRLAEQAAAESDALGSELLAEGLQMDERSEEARDTLESICGDVINVNDLEGDPAACTCPGGEPECMTSTCGGGAPGCAEPTCGGGYVCRPPRLGGSFRCFPRDLTAALNNGNPGLDSVRRCLGDAGDLVNAALGDRPLCLWRSATDLGRAPCECDETSEDCPVGSRLATARCPAIVEPGTDCADVFFRSCPTTEDPHRVCPLDESEWTVLPLAEGLGMNVRAGGGPSPAMCDRLAQLRTQRGHPGESDRPVAMDIEEFIRQGWLDRARIHDVGVLLGYEEGLFQMASVTRGGATWLTTGREDVGPSGEFPCAQLGMSDEIAEYVCEPGRYPSAGNSLYCGMDCTTAGARRNANLRLRDAVWTLRVIGGSDVAGLITPLHVGGESANADFLRQQPFQYAACSEHGETRCDGWAFFRCVNGLDLWGICPGADCGELIGGETACVQNTSFGPDTALPPWIATAFGAAGRIISHAGQRTGARCIEVTSGPTSNELEFDTLMGIPVCPIYHDSRRLMPSGESMPRTGFDRLGDLWRPSTDSPNSIFALLRATQDHTPSTTAPFATQRAQLGELREPGAERVANAMVLDALELACLAEVSVGGGCGEAGAVPPPIRSAADFPVARRILECAADRFDDSLRSLTIVGIPRQLANDLADSTISPTFPRYRGEYGQTVAELRGALESIANASAQVSSNLRAFSFELDAATSRIRLLNLQEEASVFRTISAISSAAANCGSGVVPWQIASACSDMVTQTIVAVSLHRIAVESADVETRMALRELTEQMGARTDNVAAAIRQLSEGYANVSRLLAKLEEQRGTARRAAAGVLGLERDDMGREYNVYPRMRDRFDSTRTRYEGAHRAAIQYAWLARRAIEQRLGVDMSRLTYDMSLVPAPAKWADRICTMRGVDYEALSDYDHGVRDVGDSFVGDYVRTLRQFIESYRLDFPFQNGSDVAVISLRDDLFQARRACEVEGHNLLLWSSDLTHPSIDGNPGWTRTCDGPDCLVMSPSRGSPFVSVSTQPEGAPLATTADRPLGGARAARMELYDDPMGSGATLWEQTIDIPPGDVVVSWYEEIPDQVGCPATMPPTADPSGGPTIGLVVTGADGPLTVPQPAWVPVESGTPLQAIDVWLDHCRWRRAYAPFASDRAQRVTLSFSLAGATTSAVWAAPQVEVLPPSAAAEGPLYPRLFFPTGDSRSWPVGLCDDVNGDVFRSSRHWVRSCEYLCSDGFGATCAAGEGVDRATERCFWESRFAINLRDVERGRLLPTGTLALGNFNYRFDTFALNLVGVGVRDCTAVPESSVCHASGYIPFSLRHEPPFTIRNHMGEEVEALLFTGNVEQGKALAAERYITNPLSSADRTLLADYMRRELRGRPLDGHFRLRIYDTPGLDWSRVEDIQLITNYRYWTRFE